jgi:hypothetical protein
MAMTWLGPPGIISVDGIAHGLPTGIQIVAAQCRGDLCDAADGTEGSPSLADAIDARN